MVVFKRKQIVVLSLVLMIVVAGYLQYSYRKSSISVSGKENNKIGEAVYVENSKETTTTKATSASEEANSFFAQAKLDREIIRSKNTDSLKEITESSSLSKDEMKEALDQIVKISNTTDKEMRMEALIKEKGYLDSVVLFGDDGSLDVVIKSASLTPAQIAQVADIVSRQGNVNLEKVHVRNVF